MSGVAVTSKSTNSQDWQDWGLAALTGPAAGPPSPPVPGLTASVRALLDELGERTGGPLDPAHLLTRRAALHGWARAGQVSVNGSCRLLPAADGWLAVNLSRPDDVAAVPALLRRELTAGPWDELAAAALVTPAAVLAADAQELGVPAAVLGDDAGLAPVRVTRIGAAADRTGGRVLDFSALWAGPLCAHLLGRAGLPVTKVEDVRRPDGARSGPPEFYADLHGGHDSVVLDLTRRAELHRLADTATVVIESSRPRALRALGLVAEDWLAARPGRTWISITGYGRADPAGRVAFGDDAAVAGGLVGRGPDGTPVFCGDAIADPLSGLHAAAAGLRSLDAGGGHLVDVAMAGASAAAAGAGR